MRRLGILFICLVFLAAMFIPVFAQTEEAFAFKFTIHAWSPIRIVVTCVYTQNITNPAVVTTNQSGFQFNINTAGHTTAITFSTGDVDTFQFGFTVYYPVGVSQIVEVDVIQGGAQTENMEQLPVFGPAFSMSFTLITAVEPHYPGAQDLINVILGNYPTMQNFNEWTGIQKAQYDILNANQTWQWITILAVIGLIVIFEVISKWPQLRRASKEESS